MKCRLVLQCCLLALCSLGSVAFAADRASNDSLLNNALSVWRAGDFASAEKMLSEIIENGTDDPRPLYFRGILAEQMGHDGTADLKAAAVAVGLDAVPAAVAAALLGVQDGLLAAATARRDNRTVSVGTIDEAAEAAQSGFARIRWSVLGEQGEEVLAAKAITVRCLQNPDGTIPAEIDDEVVAVVARAY